MPMNYRSYDDEALRRALIADPYDTIAICEAAERFVKQAPDSRRHEFDLHVQCPECEHAWDEEVDILDFLPEYAA